MANTIYFDPDEASEDGTSETVSVLSNGETSVELDHRSDAKVDVLSVIRTNCFGFSRSSAAVEEEDDEVVDENGFRNNNLPNHLHGELVAAGWPSWLSSVAAEAIIGLIPRRAVTFDKLDKVAGETRSNVYKARDILTGKIVALKKIQFDNLDTESVKSMAREILILRRLDHPNVIKFEGLVASSRSCSLYLVFEYMEHDLADLIKIRGEISFTEPQVKCYMHQLLLGLDHCHSRRVSHRNINPSNLLINNEGILKIAGFGSSSFFSPIHKRPRTSMEFELWYRPPELLLGATDYGPGVDLWSTGCILAELFKGNPIMSGCIEVEILFEIFKLCGSPSEDYRRKLKLLHPTKFESQFPHRRYKAETLKDFPPSSLPLIETLLAIEPHKRQNATAALRSKFFTTKPYACKPSSLPRYPTKRELNAKLRNEETRLQASGGKANGNGVKLTRTSDRIIRDIPAPEANSELQPKFKGIKGIPYSEGPFWRPVWI